MPNPSLSTTLLASSLTLLALDASAEPPRDELLVILHDANGAEVSARYPNLSHAECSRALRIIGAGDALLAAIVPVRCADFPLVTAYCSRVAEPRQ